MLLFYICKAQIRNHKAVSTKMFKTLNGMNIEWLIEIIF